MSSPAEVIAAVGSALSGDASIEVETTLTPKLTVSAADALAEGGPSPFMRLLCPRVTIRAGGTVVKVLEPAGSLANAPPWGLILVGAGSLVSFLLWRALR